MLKAITKKRLLALATFLAKVPDHKFDLESWGSTDNLDDESLQALNLDDGVSFADCAANVCGTTACALGWAASMPKNRKAGLDLIAVTDGMFGPVDVYWKIRYRKRVRRSGKRDKYITYGNFEAGVKFFHLGGYQEACYFFDPDWYPEDASRAKDVAERIRDYVKTEGKSFDRWMKDHITESGEVDPEMAG